MLRKVFVLLLLSCTAAFAAPDWNGMWIGNWNTGNGTQIIFAGNEFTGIFWEGDYVPDAVGTVSKDGKTVAITWAGASATLTRDGDTTGHIVIHEKGKPDAAFAVKKDGG